MDIHHSDRTSLQYLLKQDGLTEIPIPGFFLMDLVSNPGLALLALQLHHFWSAKAHPVMLLPPLRTLALLTCSKGLFVLYCSPLNLTEEIKGAKKGPEEDTCF